MELRHALPLALLCACANMIPKRLIVPEDMRAKPGAAAAPQSRAGAPRDPYTEFNTYGDPEIVAQPASQQRAPAKGAPATTTRTVQQPAPPARQRYVLRMVEHGRIWEVELPEASGGYEVRIPLAKPEEMPTAADDELLGKHPAAPTAKSYLGSLARVSELYSGHQYEMALIELVDLEQQYPKEPRIPAMKGSLYQKLGKAQLARESWKKALELNPNDTAVAEALRGLKEE